jgi:hypothetical protein
MRRRRRLAIATALFVRWAIATPRAVTPAIESVLSYNQPRHTHLPSPTSNLSVPRPGPPKVPSTPHAPH